MFRVPTDIKAGRAITINGQSYAKDARIEADDLATIAGRLHVFMSKGLLYANPDPHARKTAAGSRQPGFLPPVILNATLAQEVVQDAPGAPTGLVATPSDGEVSIAFTPHAGTAATTGYQYKVGNGAWTATVPPTTQSPIVVDGLTNGATVNIRVRGINKYGNGTPSDPLATASYDVPAAPSALVATPGDESVSIAFTAGATGGSAITNYEFNLDDAGWVALAPPDAATPVTIPSLVAETEYSVLLRAVNAAGSGAASAACVFTTTA